MGARTAGASSPLETGDRVRRTVPLGAKGTLAAGKPRGPSHCSSDGEGVQRPPPAACPLLCDKQYFIRHMELHSSLMAKGIDLIKLEPLPKDWKIYHSSTRKALEAGQISKQWFDDFTSIISDDELPTRLWGAWPK